MREMQLIPLIGGLAVYRGRGPRPAPKPHFTQKVNAIGTHQRVVKTLGSLALLKAMAEEMNLRGIIDTLVPWHGPKASATHGEVLEALVLNRLHSPRPLYRFDQWAAVSGLADLYGRSADRFHDDRLRETLDQVHAYDEEIQTAMALRSITHFGVPADSVLYDITSLYFEGEHTESELIEYGYSRDQKPDKKQINLGLTVSAEGGVPLLGRTLKGSTADVTTVEANTEALRRIIGRKELLTVTDGGMLSPANVVMLERQGVTFVAPWNAETAVLQALTAPNTQWPWAELSYRGATGRETYWATEMGLPVVYDEVLTDQPAPPRQPGQRGRLPEHPKVRHIHWERAICVRATSKMSRDEKHRIKHLAAIEQQLTRLHEGLGKRRLKRRAAVEARLMQILGGECARYRACVEWTLTGGETEEEPMTFAWQWDQAAIDQFKRCEGIYILITNLKDLDTYPPAEIVQLYKRRNPVEDRIRTLKSTVKVRPLFVHTDERVRALVLVTVLALTLYSLIEWRARQSQEAWTTRFLAQEFEGIAVLQTHYADGRIELEWCNLMPRHHSLLRRLGLKLTDLPDYVFPSPFT